MLKRALPVLLALFAVSGCAAAQRWLPVVADIIAVVAEAQGKLAQAEALAAPIVRALPADKQAAVAEAEARCDRALSALASIAHGAKDVDQGKLDAAFAEFAAAWEDLSAELVAVGAARAAPGGGHLMAARPGGTPALIDPPIAATPHPVQVQP